MPNYYQIPKSKHGAHKAAGCLFRNASVRHDIPHAAEIQTRLAMAIKTCARF